MKPDETPLTAEVLLDANDQTLLELLQVSLPETASNPTTTLIRSLLEQVYAREEFTDDRGILRGAVQQSETSFRETDSQLATPEAQIIAQVRGLINGQIKCREDVSKWAEVIKAIGDGDLAYSFGVGVGNDSHLSLLGSVDYHKFIDDMLFSPEMQMEIVRQGREIWSPRAESATQGHPLFNDLLRNKHLSPEAQMGFFNYTGEDGSAKYEITRNPHANSPELLKAILAGTDYESKTLQIVLLFSDRNFDNMPEIKEIIERDEIFSFFLRAATDAETELEMINQIIKSGSDNAYYLPVLRHAKILSIKAADLVGLELAKWREQGNYGVNSNLKKWK